MGNDVKALQLPPVVFMVTDHDPSKALPAEAADPPHAIAATAKATFNRVARMASLP
jgi:hypothetical protein